MSTHRIVLSAFLGVGFLLSLAWAVEPPPSPSITLEQALHLTGPDGNPVVLEPGSYAVEAGETGIRFIKGPTAVLVQTQATTHTEQLSTPTALLIPGEGDIRHVVLLLPDGRGLDAIGSLSGVQSRGATGYQVLGAGQISQAAILLQNAAMARPEMAGMVLQGGIATMVPSCGLFQLPAPAINSQYPTPPAWTCPGDGTILRDIQPATPQLGPGPSVTFSWVGSQGTVPAAYYQVCAWVEGSSDYCNKGPGGQLVLLEQVPSSQTMLATRIPINHQGKMFRWAVLACKSTPDTGTCNATPAQRMTFAPDPPVLMTPADRTIMNGSLVRFAWQPATGVPSSLTYRVCVTIEGQTCQSQTAWNSPGVGQPRLSSTEMQRDLPSDLFQGKRLTWTVEACVPQSPQSVGGGSLPNVCSSATPRHLSWPLSPPRLGSPSDGTTLTGFRPTLNIFTDVPGADSYLFCISQPGVGCPTTSTRNNTTVVVQVDNYYRQWTPGQDLSQFTGQTVHWTAAACNPLFGCIYQQNVRQLTFPPVMVPIYLRLHGNLDVNEVWIVRGGAPGFPRVEEVTIRDLFPYTEQDYQRERQQGGTAPYHDTELRIMVPKRHNPGLEPRVPDYYALEFMEERMGAGQLMYVKRDGTSFAPGVLYAPGYTIIRETIFLWGSNSYPRSRHELVLRGPDGRLYIHRPYCPGLQAGVAPPELRVGCDGPVPLDTFPPGYGFYTPAQLGQ